MKSKQTIFFATLADIEPIIKSIEAFYKIQYFETGLLSDRNIPNYYSAALIPNFGYTNYGNWNASLSYLIMPQDATLNVRDVLQIRGGIKYAVDQMINKESIEFKPGGIYTVKDKIIIAGRIATVSDLVFSKVLYKAFSLKIKNEFRLIDSFYVGREAEEKLKSGWRLVTNEKLSAGFDLKLLPER